jgi:hypothetical protein
LRRLSFIELKLTSFRNFPGLPRLYEAPDQIPMGSP